MDPRGAGKEAFTHAALLLGGSDRITVCTGVASIWGRDPMTAAAAMSTVGEAFPNRLVVGLGVSHRSIVEQLRGQTYTSPVRTMERYLERLGSAAYEAVRPEHAAGRAGRTGAAHAAARGEHGRRAHVLRSRRAHGAGPAAPRSGAAAGGGARRRGGGRPGRARHLARLYTSRYLRLENYRNNLVRLGWPEDELTDGGSDRVVDALVAWGDGDTIRDRVRAHLDAGADHVCIQVLREDRAELGLEELRGWRPSCSAERSATR